MKKLLQALLVVLLVCLSLTSISAEEQDVKILVQPQNSVFKPGSTATYTVDVLNPNNRKLTYHWYVEKNGTVYDTQGSDISWVDATSAGASQTGEMYWFAGVGEGMSGCYIWCEIDCGDYKLTSSKAMITITEIPSVAPTTIVPAKVEVELGKSVEFEVEVKSEFDKSEISYMWYESATGNIINSIAINRGAETNKSLVVTGSELGTRYFMCMVSTAAGNYTYTSLVEVVTVEGLKDEAIEIETAPKKLTYKLGDTLDLSGLTIKVKTNKNTTYTVDDLSKVKTNVTSLNMTGVNTITVDYNGLTTTFTVTVKEASNLMIFIAGGVGVVIGLLVSLLASKKRK